jgi:hypothetical protein
MQRPWKSILDIVAIFPLSKDTAKATEILLQWEGKSPLHPYHPGPLLPVATYSVQWAAVSTQQGWISDPPQKCPWGMEMVIVIEVCRDTCHGCLPAVLLKPP